MRITNCTVSGNSAPSGGAIEAPYLAVTLNNSIVVSNFDQGTDRTEDDIDGAFTGSNNVIGSGTFSGLMNGSNGNMLGVSNAGLAPLGNYGGPTQTVALLPGSPALDAGSNALAVDANGNPLTTDQRGLPRIFNGTVDIGAYEAQPPALAGDVNHDGTVNFSDVLALIQHYGSGTQPLYEGGDLTGDGSVNFSDVLLLIQNYGHSSTGARPQPGAAVPDRRLHSGKPPAKCRAVIGRARAKLAP